MKSIIEEASSIVKAIEKGWASAGKPTEFTVKVLETPEYNFFGFNTKPAKISLFFNDKIVAHDKQRSDKRQQSQNRLQLQSRQQQARTPERTAQPERVQPQSKKPAQTRVLPEQTSVTWPSDMIQQANEWVAQFLKVIHKETITFKTTPQNHILKIDFSDHITENKHKELTLYKSCAHLLMSSLRNASNSELKQLKVVFSSQE
jgi:hypothetical protein